MNADAFIDRAIADAEARRTTHVGNPDRAAVLQAIADRVAANRGREVPVGRHKQVPR